MHAPSLLLAHLLCLCYLFCLVNPPSAETKWLSWLLVGNQKLLHRTNCLWSTKYSFAEKVKQQNVRLHEKKCSRPTKITPWGQEMVSICMYEFNHCEYSVTGSLQCRRILEGWVEYFHRMFRPPSWNWKNSGELGRGKKSKKFTKRGREKENLGKGDILSFSLQFSQSAVNPKWRQNTRKTTKTACTAGYVTGVMVDPWLRCLGYFLHTTVALPIPSFAMWHLPPIKYWQV